MYRLSYIHYTMDDDIPQPNKEGSVNGNSLLISKNNVPNIVPSSLSASFSS